MLLRAAGELGIDLAQSWMVGDRWLDVDSWAIPAGCKDHFCRSGLRGGIETKT